MKRAAVAAAIGVAIEVPVTVLYSPSPRVKGQDDFIPSPRNLYLEKVSLSSSGGLKEDVTPSKFDELIPKTFVLDAGHAMCLSVAAPLFETAAKTKMSFLSASLKAVSMQEIPLSNPRDREMTLTFHSLIE
jgi:hypothetical protein